MARRITENINEEAYFGGPVLVSVRGSRQSRQNRFSLVRCETDFPTFSCREKKAAELGSLMNAVLKDQKKIRYLKNRRLYTQVEKVK